MKDVKTRFITSDFKLERPLPTAKNEKVIELMKNELGGKRMTEFAALQSKHIPLEQMIMKGTKPKAQKMS